MNGRKLLTRDVPKHLRGDYTGRKFRAVVTNEVTIPSDAGTWDGGTCSKFSLVQLADGQARDMVSARRAPWDPARRNLKVEIPAGCAVVERAGFQGHECGLTFYLRAEDAAPFRRDTTPAITDGGAS